MPQSAQVLMKKTAVLILLLILLSAVNGCRGSKHGAPPENGGEKRRRMMPAMEGFVVKPAVLSRNITVSGTVKPFEETVLMPEVTGRVVAIHLPEGKVVAKGTLLVKLFDGDLQAQLAKAKAQLDIARQTSERLGELIKVNGVSRSEYDQAVLQVNSLTADIDIINVQIGKTEIRAPYEGVLGLRTVSVGAQVTPQTPLVTIRAVDNLKLDFSVPEKYSAVVAPGMPVSFTVEGDATTYGASVTASERNIDAATRNLRVRALVAGKTPLETGLFARVIVDLGTDSNALMIPTQSIIPQERGKVVVVLRAGKAKFTPVTTGIRQEATVEAVHGLSVGDTILTTGLLFVKPGMPVKLSRLVQ